MSSPLPEEPSSQRRRGARWRGPTLLLVALFAAWPGGHPEAAALEGVLYLSTTGDLRGEVFWGGGEEVRVLKPAFAAERDELRRRTLPRIVAADRAADAALADLLQSPPEERRRRESRYREAEEGRRKARREYEATVDAVLSGHTVASARADPKGRFRFEQIPPGRYLVHARMALPAMGLFYQWLVEVKVEEKGAVRVELTTKNAASLYY